MTSQLVRKPAIGNQKIDRFKVTLLGRHSTKQKICMLLQAKFFLHEQGIDNAGLSDAYFALLDPDGHPLTQFRDGRLICDYNLVIDTPYHCAADEYDRRPVRPSGFTLS